VGITSNSCDTPEASDATSVTCMLVVCAFFVSPLRPPLNPCHHCPCDCVPGAPAPIDNPLIRARLAGPSLCQCSSPCTFSHRSPCDFLPHSRARITPVSSHSRTCWRPPCRCPKNPAAEACTRLPPQCPSANDPTVMPSCSACGLSPRSRCRSGSTGTQRHRLRWKTVAGYGRT
jgi:hypothetical protein